jgi:serine phosphatase RsbU (regulator of sigma subunit)
MTGFTSTISADAPAATGDAQAAAPPRQSPARHSMYRLPAITLVVGLIVTGVLTALSRTVYLHNEHRLLRLRVRDAAALVTDAVPAIQTPLASVAELADATGGSKSRFRSFASTYVGPGKEFSSLSIWDLRHRADTPVAVVGAPLQLPAHRALIPGYLDRVDRARTMSVIGLLDTSRPRLGYGYSTPGQSRYAAYAEAALPRSRYAPVAKGSPFSGMRFALYLEQGKQSELLATDVHALPVSGGVTERVPFGDSALTLTMSSQSPLAGALPQELPWIIAVGGILLSLAAAAGAFRLTERRLDAEGLAGELEVVAEENRELYSEQRSIAQTLQHALLPEELPQLPGLQTAGRYVAGERSVDIGGDWYDVIQLGQGRVMLVVGDVSGRGLRAATTMASLRFAIRAYTAEEDRPEMILSKLSGLLDLSRDGQLATALCARIDAPARQVTLASAGHLPALLLAGEEARFLEAPVGVPVGVERAAAYRPVTVTVPPGATLLAFTDGLVERRGEDLQASLERLRNGALRVRLTLPELLDKLVADLTVGEAKDDIAIVGLRWTS